MTETTEITGQLGLINVPYSPLGLIVLGLILDDPLDPFTHTPQQIQPGSMGGAIGGNGRTEHLEVRSKNKWPTRK